ncbi:DUF2778 domain-containing protein [Agrobacterium vitis]|uniref:DUF2778 domain-containing protein n=1 Tax=Agrobacterium vitis TaxID=373 RepID=UPI0012E8133D|nr:DUF2778 domain-containing protein [Agrobacterium vitis]MVA61343.1 DUF2778 domain-containing protein [Agrobacterium vitis]
MVDCTFELNGLPMSTLKCGASSVEAFSGLGLNVNRREAACSPYVGPLPPGVYYIVDRQSGGILGSLRDFFRDRSEWFALYAIDQKIDDEMFCDQVKRGHFRLHPKGPLGISEGCITVNNKSDFMQIRSILLKSSTLPVPGTSLKAYGKVTVK